MKKNVFISALIMLAFFWLAACTSQSTDGEETKDSTEVTASDVQVNEADKALADEANAAKPAYACPSCGKESTSAEPGKCPKCGMEFEKYEDLYGSEEKTNQTQE